MKFEEFEKLVQVEFIEDILKPFSPQITHRREYEGQYYPGYEIGVNIDSCIFQFAWEEGGGIMIGPLTNTFEDNESKWFSLDRIICFVLNQPFVWKSPYEHLKRDEKIVATFRNTRKAFVPCSKKTIKMFSNKLKMSEWMPNYNEYEDEQFRLKYPSLYEEYKRRKYK